MEYVVHKYLVSPYRRDYCVKDNQSNSDANNYCEQGRKVCDQARSAGKHCVRHILSPIYKHKFFG